MFSWAIYLGFAWEREFPEGDFFLRLIFIVRNSIGFEELKEKSKYVSFVTELCKDT